MCSTYARILKIDLTRERDIGIIKSYIPYNKNNLTEQAVLFRRFLWKVPGELTLSTLKTNNGKESIENIKAMVFPMDLYGRINKIECMEQYLNVPIYIRKIPKKSIYRSIMYFEKNVTDFSFFGFIQNGPDNFGIGKSVNINGITDFVQLMKNYIVPVKCDNDTIDGAIVFTGYNNDGKLQLFYSSINRDITFKRKLIKEVNSVYDMSFSLSNQV
jgi:hypothetical protein